MYGIRPGSVIAACGVWNAANVILVLPSYLEAVALVLPPLQPSPNGHE